MQHPQSVTLGVTIKNSIKALLAAFALVGMAGTSEAVSITYVDIDKPADNVNFLEGYHGLFNIVNPGAQTFDLSNPVRPPQGGYVIGTELLSAKASFYLYNKRQNLFETASVFIGVLDGEWLQPIATGHDVLNLDASPFSLEILRTTGMINYAVKSSLLGDFDLLYAVLEVEAVASPTQAPSVGVPDGGTTLVLMGLGLIGLVAVQSRLTRQTA